MKRVMFFMTVLFAAVSFAQNATSIELEKSKLKQAKSFSDQNQMIDALYNLIALEGEASSYKDSLVYVYFEQGRYVQSFLVADDVLKRNPDNEELLEIHAISLESIGVYDKAASSYAKIFRKKKSIYHGYKQASLLFGMKEYDQAMAVIKVIDGMPNPEEVKVNFQVNQNFTQQIDIKGAVAYLEGLTYLAQEKNAEAEKSFNRAILIYPEFVLAKTALNNLKNTAEEKKE